MKDLRQKWKVKQNFFRGAYTGSQRQGLLREITEP